MKALQWFGKLVKETPIEILLLAVIGAGIAGTGLELLGRRIYPPK